jgi:hypothetical protein
LGYKGRKKKGGTTQNLNSYASGIKNQKIIRNTKNNKKKYIEKLSAVLNGDFPRGRNTMKPQDDYDYEAGPSNEWWKDPT